jgi:hypothetical protein
MKSYFDFLNESLLEADSSEKAKSKISPDLDNLMENKWRIATIKKEWDKKHNNSWSKLEEEIDKKVGEIKDKYRDKDGKLPDDIKPVVNEITKSRDAMRSEFVKKEVSKDPQFKDEVEGYYKKQDRFFELGNKLNKEGFEKFKKDNAKEYDELLDLQANHMNPVRIDKRPGGIMQVSTSNMERGGDKDKPGYVELPPEVGAEAFQRSVKQYIDKNGKPKGVIMDLRINTGGNQEIAKSMTDVFVDKDDYEIESQKFNYGPRIWKDDPDGLAKYKKTKWDDKVMDHLNSLDEKGQKEYWEEAKKKGHFELPNNRKNLIDKKYRLSGIPTVIQTSTKTFSAGEFATDTIKNLNPDTVHLGSNSGGGANQTFGGTPPDKYDEKGNPVWDNVSKTGKEKAEIVAKAFKDTFHDQQRGQEVYDEIMAKVKSGDIKDDMDSQKVADITKDIAIKITKDNHANVHIESNGSVFPLVPQVKSDRVVVDPKTRKTILKDGKLQYDGNWEATGVGSANTGAFIESDPNLATKDALEFLYKKTGQDKLAKELNNDPEKFGLSKDGSDGVFNDKLDAHKSYFATKELSEEHGEYSQRQAEQLENSKKIAEDNKKKGISISDELIKKQKDFISQNDNDAEEVENTQKLFSGFDEKTVKQLKDMKITYKEAAGAKPKEIQLETLMDWLPVDINDPDEAPRIKVQELWYNKINNLRLDKKLKELIEYQVWLSKRIEKALKNDKSYQERFKNRFKDDMKKPKPVKPEKAKNEGRLLDFKSFISENID